MPQMSPILWMNLYVTFTVTLVVFIAMFSFMKTPKTMPQAEDAPATQELSWKW